MNEYINKSSYIDHAIKSIENKRRFSIENIHKTNLYSNKEFMEFMVWFDDIIDLIKNIPPKGYVRVISIRKDDNGKVTSIKYEYFKTNEIILDSELKILY